MSIKKYSDFMCKCTVEGAQHCFNTLQQVYDELQCDATNLFSAVVYVLEFEQAYAVIEGISSDQWAVIQGTVYVHQNSYKYYQKISEIEVQCDELEAGIARFYLSCKESLNNMENKNNV